MSGVESLKRSRGPKGNPVTISLSKVTLPGLAALRQLVQLTGVNRPGPPLVKAKPEVPNRACGVRERKKT